MRARSRTASITGSAALLLLVLLALVPVPARAGSVFAVGGLGEPALEENARLRALGGAGAAEHGAHQFSLVNPASIAGAQHLSLEASGLWTRRSVLTESFGSQSAHEPSFPSFRLVVRLPAKMILGGAYLAGTNAQFEVERPESAGAASSLRIEGTGGIAFARATLARELTPEIRAGVDFEIVAGSYREEWARTFADPTLAASRDTLEFSWSRVGRWRFGAQYVRRRLAIGAAYETARRLPASERQRTAGSDVRVTGLEFRIPSGFAGGFQVSLSDRNRVVGQYRRSNWGSESLQSDLVELRAQERYSVGFERGAGEGGGSLQRLPLRLGATFLRWPDRLPRAGAEDVQGGTAGVDEWALSIGTGLMTVDRGGALDLSVEGGRRGDVEELGARETFFRVALSLRVSDETWK